MIKQECIGIPDMILLLMIFCFKKIKIKAEIVLSPGGAYFLFYTLGHAHMARRFAPAFRALGLCEYSWVHYNNFDEQIVGPQFFGPK